METLILPVGITSVLLIVLGANFKHNRRGQVDPWMAFVSVLVLAGLAVCAVWMLGLGG